MFYFVWDAGVLCRDLLILMVKHGRPRCVSPLILLPFLFLWPWLAAVLIVYSAVVSVFWAQQNHCPGHKGLSLIGETISYLANSEAFLSKKRLDFGSVFYSFLGTM